jgi:hypothetical protein
VEKGGAGTKENSSARVGRGRKARAGRGRKARARSRGPGYDVTNSLCIFFIRTSGQGGVISWSQPGGEDLCVSIPWPQSARMQHEEIKSHFKPTDVEYGSPYSTSHRKSSHIIPRQGSTSYQKASGRCAAPWLNYRQGVAALRPG